ncbi:MAG: rhodanese-like domain-containing protein [Desulfobulbaceae bacterium]|nr:rhodanese-like domain-containing protein [Desulfobulbaceae bacterium]
MNTIKSTVLALIAVAATVFFVWYGQQPGAPAQATWDDVLAEAKAGGYHIITTEELADRYTSDPSAQLLVDTRQEWEYRTGHLEGAVNFPMEPTWWSRWRSADKLEDFLGPDKERELVFY